MKTSLLDQLRDEHPVFYTLISRPAVGQGGYQDRIRRMQADLGIVPSEAAMNATPASRRTFHTNEGNEPTATAAATTNPINGIVAAVAKAKLDAGDLEGALILLRQAETLLHGSQAAAEADDDEAGETGLNIIAAKAAATKTAKATLRAAGRKRRSPKLTDAGRAKRTHRMLLLHHDPRMAGRKMREKFGEGWRDLLAE